MTKITIGRPAYGRPAGNEAAKRAFGGAKFPLSVKISNRLTVALSLPEAKIKLGPMASAVAVVFSDFDRLQRTVSSLEQIARLNDASEVVTLEAELGDNDASADESAQPNASQDTGGSESTGDKQGGADPAAVTIVQDDDEAFIVELDGVQFEPQRNQVRDDNSLTSGGIAAFNEAKAAAGKVE